MAGDALLTAAREILEDSFRDIRENIEGLPVEALNWRPIENDANSLAAIVSHAMGATRAWLYVAFALPPPQRDRDAEFRAAASDAAEVLRLIDTARKDCLDAIEGATGFDSATMRRSHMLDAAGNPVDVSSVWALLHAVDHLREHVGQVFLTRQIWKEGR